MKDPAAGGGCHRLQRSSPRNCYSRGGAGNSLNMFWEFCVVGVEVEHDIFNFLVSLKTHNATAQPKD